MFFGCAMRHCYFRATGLRQIAPSGLPRRRHIPRVLLISEQDFHGQCAEQVDTRSTALLPQSPGASGGHQVRSQKLEQAHR